ncbi:NUDIX domain-containing protein [Methylobacterium sp. IF7SW-B2]|jgi:8-oxo-dGTP pyrophosphatase MutT (NUDIX family)|nr:NUDIX domain-containing protein [Methylobacterium ajmalii]MBK3408605.1 NUDIX domain-containing protein [Methylobacterium ajmalii]MBK3422490.1 NUDIX domain-containing protein [Methylobacterium ajmalii]SFF74565.1 8-oxo-dGTP pyrophosphatase MutT, NUDIX family [Methylobacterium sp. yr596]
MRSLKALAGALTGWSERNGEPRRQVGVLPLRTLPGGEMQVMLITSRETRRWVVPKGWPMKGLKNYEAAAREAYEEAGLIGRVGRRALGSYFYQKRLKSRDTVLCQVQVFRLEVRKQLKTWPEQHERDCRWFSVPDAAEAVTEAGLAALIRAAGADGAKAKAKVKAAAHAGSAAKDTVAKDASAREASAKRPAAKASTSRESGGKGSAAKGPAGRAP